MNDFFIFVALLFLSAFFSGTETAFTALNEISLFAQTDKPNRRQKLVLAMVKDKPSVIAALLVGNNIVNTALAVYAGVVADKLLVETKILSETQGPVVASIITIVFLLIFGEIIPKQLGISFAKGWTAIATYPLWMTVCALKPVTRAMNYVSGFLFRLLPFKGDRDNAPTIQEIMIMANYSQKAGHIDSIEHRLMQRSSSFNDATAREIMIPRNLVSAVPSTIKLQDLIAIYRNDLYSRVPVYEENIDKILGIFNFKELFKLDSASHDSFNIVESMNKPVYIPENVRIGELFERMKNSRTHMAVVVDEFGATSGIITMEDILERLFGLIGDEYDNEADEEKFFRNTENGGLEVSGSISLQELGTSLNIVFSDEIRHRVSTLNGFLTDLNGDFLEIDDELAWEKLRFKIISMNNYCADKVLIDDSLIREQNPS